MVRSHVVPKLIIERFANPINVFDIQTGYLKKNRSPKKVFNEEDAYEDDVEMQLCQKIENPFATLIDKKIIGKKSIVLTKDELMLVKRFMLVQSIRTAGPDAFYDILSNYKDAVDMFIKMNGPTLDPLIKKIPSITEKTEDKFTLYMQAMKMFSECVVAEAMMKHEYVTKESYFWAKAFQDAYLVFWDSYEKQDFILTDNGTAMEYDISAKLIDGGLGLSKSSYLNAQLQKHLKDRFRAARYSDLLLKNQTMYENFSVFNLTSNRCIAIVNPFFRLYSDKPIWLIQFDEYLSFDIPDIWPTFISKEALQVPENRYIKEQLNLSEYIYTPHRLSFLETVYVNTLLLNGASTIGFKDILKITESLYCMAAWNAGNKEDVYQNDIFKREVFGEHFYESTYVKMVVREYNGLERIDFGWFLLFWDICKDKAAKDIFENEYLIEYLLSHEDKIKEEERFNIFGTPEERIDFLRNILDNLKKGKVD